MSKPYNAQEVLNVFESAKVATLGTFDVTVRILTDNGSFEITNIQFGPDLDAPELIIDTRRV